MSKIRVLAVAAACALAVPAWAQAPATLGVDKSVAIDAPPAKVWAMVRNFADLTWHPVIKASSATDGNTPGSVRTLDLGGPKLVEQLVSYGPGMTYTYRITDLPANAAVLPVTHYISTITIRPGPNKTTLADWQGTFTRVDPSGTPAAGHDDAAATKAIDGVYAAGLDALKKTAEAD